MGFFTGDIKYYTNPLAQQGITGLEDFANTVNLGAAGKFAKNTLKDMNSGDYSGVAGTMLSPIHDRYATNLREAIRAGGMGGNAFALGSQPALMASIEQEQRRKMAEGEGLAYGQAVPELYQTMANTYQNALNNKQQTKLASLEAALRGRLGAVTPQQTKSAWENITGVANQVAAWI